MTFFQIALIASPGIVTIAILAALSAWEGYASRY